MASRGNVMPRRQVPPFPRRRSIRPGAIRLAPGRRSAHRRTRRPRARTSVGLSRARSRGGGRPTSISTRRRPACVRTVRRAPSEAGQGAHPTRPSAPSGARRRWGAAGLSSPGRSEAETTSRARPRQEIRGTVPERDQEVCHRGRRFAGPLGGSPPGGRLGRSWLAARPRCVSRDSLKRGETATRACSRRSSGHGPGSACAGRTRRKGGPSCVPCPSRPGRRAGPCVDCGAPGLSAARKRCTGPVFPGTGLARRHPPSLKPR